MTKRIILIFSNRLRAVSLGLRIAERQEIPNKWHLPYPGGIILGIYKE
jgi:hypothetical protein